MHDCLQLNLRVHAQLFVAALGVAAVGAETLIAVPQLVRNYERKETEGVSAVMVLGWLLGDLCKGAYYAVAGAPTQFIYGAVLQLCTDVAVTAQLFVLYPSKETVALLHKWGLEKAARLGRRKRLPHTRAESL
jgi:PQ loop repeat